MALGMPHSNGIFTAISWRMLSWPAVMATRLQQAAANCQRLHGDLLICPFSWLTCLLDICDTVRQVFFRAAGPLTHWAAAAATLNWPPQAFFMPFSSAQLSTYLLFIFIFIFMVFYFTQPIALTPSLTLSLSFSDALGRFSLPLLQRSLGRKFSFFCALILIRAHFAHQFQ